MSNNKILAPQTYISPGDTKWAVVAQVQPSILKAARHRLSELIRTDGSEVVTGDQGMSALLAFGGSTGEGEDLAIKLSRKYRIPVYVLDFDDELDSEDEACAIRQFEGAMLTWLKGHPAAFLESYGITPPGYGPLPESPVTTIGVVDGVTVEQARTAMPEAQDLFVANARGVLVRDLSGTVTSRLASEVHRVSYVVFYDREEKTFLCSVCHPDQMGEECFSLGMETGGSPLIDSILGETTMDGILRVLGIPRDLLIAGDLPVSPASDAGDDMEP
jgi:hypothetical protein